LIVRVYKDGKLVSESTASDLKTVELENNEVKLLALKGVEKGCMIETLILKRLPLDLNDFEYLQDDAPKRNIEFRLYVPKLFRFRVRGYNGLEEAKVETSAWQRIYHINQNNIPALLDEKYTFGTANRMRVHYAIHENTNSGYIFNRFEDMGDDFYEGIMKDYKKGRKLVGKIKKNAAIAKTDDVRTQIYKVEHWIKTNVVGIPGLESADKLADVLKQHYGSQRDVLRLFMYSFEEMQIPYEIILTTDKTRRRFDPDYESWNFLTDVLFFFPDQNEYLDPLASYVRLGRINDDFIGQEGLYCVPYTTEGGKFKTNSKIKQIPENPVEKSKDIHKVHVKLTPDMLSCELDYSRMMYGYADMNLRSAYYSSDADDAKEFIEEFVKGEAKESEIEIKEVKNYNMGSSEEYEDGFGIEAHLKTSYYVENAGDKVLIKVGELIGAQSEMYSEEPRQQPINLAYTHQYVREISIEIPEGYQAKGLEKLDINLQYKNAAGEYSMGFTSSYKVEGNVIKISCVEYYSDLNYPILQYEEFAKVINAAADFNKISILIEKK
ncbi:MAG: hypothetical protein LPK45_01290, partial [Bacteroidota bacterium]|nr:hypothetical protein [Bacteroidota bacterium]MDX5429669.1 hypothetical protein [Bacteroidota bacterium]MDX5468447.1 hypothetical protein [Bacteroidota bacterium]